MGEPVIPNERPAMVDAGDEGKPPYSDGSDLERRHFSRTMAIGTEFHVHLRTQMPTRHVHIAHARLDSPVA